MTTQMPNPWLTIILPTYNGAAYVRDALDSLATQTEGGFEVVSLDEASADGTSDIITEYADQFPIQQIDGAKLNGWVAKTNRGFEVVRTPYATMLHQDDLWWPDRMRRLRTVLQQFSEPVFLIHAVDFIDDKNNKIGRWSPPKALGKGVIDSGAMLSRLCVQNFIAVPGSVFPSETARNVGGIDPALNYTGDWDFYLKIAAAVPSVALQDSLAGYRLHSDALTLTVARDPELFSAQLSGPLEKYLPQVPEEIRGQVRIQAEFSKLVNVSLANRLHRRSIDWNMLVKLAWGLGLRGIWSYGHNSRIIQRVASRLRARKLRRDS